ncbi:MAG: TMEM14 family protein [Verrucomicrobiota bacterium]
MNVYWAIYGVLIILGGMMGFVKAKSKASLIAGTISGVLILASGYGIAHGIKAWILVGHIISLMLFVKFTIGFIKTRKPFPSLLIILLTLGGMIHTFWLVKNGN